MAKSEYRFSTNWRLQAAREEVSDLLEDVAALERWWPSVYLEVDVLDAGDDRGIGKRVNLWTKGWLPYTLRWTFIVTDSRSPEGFTIDAEGDFVGQGIWTLTQQGNETDVRFDWTISAEKPLLKYLSAVLRPIFAANHRWAMERGRESIELELQRRRNPGSAEVPAPRGPTWPHARSARGLRSRA